MKKLVTFLFLLFVPAICLGTTFTVVDSADDGTVGSNCPGNVCVGSISGDCTLRAAIECVNATADNYIINFNIPAASDPGCNPISGVCTITPALIYPNLVLSGTTTLVIDGTTELGTSCGDLWGGTPPVWTIKIDFTATATLGIGLVFPSANVTIKGLYLFKGVLWTSNTITLTNFTNGDMIQCNKIDSSPDISILFDSLDFVNTFAYIGGLNAGDGNVIVGQGTGDGAILAGPGTSILGNFIGVEEDGSTVKTNGCDGIAVGQVGLYIGIDENSGNIKGNLISGNVIGIHVSYGVAPGSSLITRIEGNYIGTDRTGLVAIPNSRAGIIIEKAALTVIGCPKEPACKNIISGNTVYGINIDYAAVETIVENNFVGVDANGNPMLCNGGAPGNDIVDSGIASLVCNNLTCPFPTNTPTATPTLTPTITPTPTLPSPGCCNYSGSLSCYDNITSTHYRGPSAEPTNCANAFPTFAATIGRFVTPGIPPFVPGYCDPAGSGDASSVCVTAPPTIRPTGTPVTPIAARPLKLILNDATTNPPNQSWAQELLRRLRNYTFLEPK